MIKNIMLKAKPGASRLVNNGSAGRGGSRREAMEAPHPFPMPCLVHLSHVAEPKLYHFIINWRSSK